MTIRTVQELKEAMTRRGRMGHGREYECGEYICTSPIEVGGQERLVANWVNNGHNPNEGNLLEFCVNKGFPRSASILLDVGARVDNPEDLIQTTLYWINQFSGYRYEQMRYEWLLDRLKRKSGGVSLDVQREVPETLPEMVNQFLNCLSDEEREKVQREIQMDRETIKAWIGK